MFQYDQKDTLQQDTTYKKEASQDNIYNPPSNQAPQFDNIQVSQLFANKSEPVNQTGMPTNLKKGIESLSGFSMDDVHVHYNSDKPQKMQALAYTEGTDIHIAPGQEKHLAHEAWHVAQQKSGMVSPTTSIGGVPVNDNAVLEQEADVMGKKAMEGSYE